jgi:hypothetical protein
VRDQLLSDNIRRSGTTFADSPQEEDGFEPSVPAVKKTAVERGVVIASLIEPEGLFVQIPAQMYRIDRDIGPLEGPLQEAPEILNVVGVGVAVHEFYGVINSLMIVNVRLATPIQTEAAPMLAHQRLRLEDNRGFKQGG